MKRYVKPDMLINEFALNEAVAYCAPEDVYNQVTVRCVISGSHAIFYDNCESDYEDCTIVTYGGSEYLVWSRGGGNSGGWAMSGESELKAILAAGTTQGVLPTGASDNWMNYHAGEITPDVSSVRNQSA